MAIKTNLGKITIRIFLLAIVLIVGIVWFSDCGDCIKKQDIDFIKKIDSHLNKVGDRIKVFEIYPGNWKEVCA